MTQCLILRDWLMKTKIEYHQYISDDYTRKGVVFRYKNDQAWYVDLLENGVSIEIRKMITDGYLHSEQYAEDCAENWVLKIF